jgi:hypothetical protein
MTQAMPTRQSAPCPRQMPYTNTVLVLRPETSAIGRLVMSPMASVMMAAPKQVAVSAAEKGTPARASMGGLIVTM